MFGIQILHYSFGLTPKKKCSYHPSESITQYCPSILSHTDFYLVSHAVPPFGPAAGASLSVEDVFPDLYTVTENCS